ncbi:MAG TPA: hypothetical protein VF070_03360 [Streptosporangiaceae bacterium]
MTGARPLPLLDPTRTAAELQARLAGLDSELDAWLAATTKEGLLRRHHTQIQAVTGTLKQVSADLAGQFDRTNPGLWMLDRIRSVDRRIMDLHRLWGFFRAKFALRYVPWLEAPLVTADDLAWDCYSPVQKFIAADQRREPPLVYFTGGTSPFLLPRGTPYVVEPLPDGSMREPEFTEAVRLVPVALIGLPWFQVDHLPDAPLIAHEVGHAVEQDLGLADRVRTLIEEAVPPERRSAWSAWSAEVFADIYGTLCCGSGFARALMALLAVHPRQVKGEVRTAAAWGSYPTRTLRVLLTAAVLTKLGVQPSDQPVADTWLATYPDRPLQDFEPDVGLIAAAVLDGPYAALGNSGLTAIIGYSDTDEQTVSRLADRLLNRFALDQGGVRHIVAAARLAYDRERDGYALQDAAQIVRAKIASLPWEGVRAAGGSGTPPEPVRSQRDQLAARALSQLIDRDN